MAGLVAPLRLWMLVKLERNDFNEIEIPHPSGSLNLAKSSPRSGLVKRAADGLVHIIIRLGINNIHDSKG
jgi:hypothetical protein